VSPEAKSDDPRTDHGVTSHAGWQGHHRSRRRSRWWIWVSCAIVVLGPIVIVVLLLLVQVLVAKNQLEAAQGLLPTLKTEASGFKFAELQKTTTKLARDTSRGVAATNTPIWRDAERVPYLGTNLYAVRVAADTTNDLVDKVVAPAVKIAATTNLTKRDKATGGFDLSPLTKAQVILAQAKTVIAVDQKRLAGVRTAQTIGQVRTKVHKLDSILTEADKAMALGGKYLKAAGPILGEDGPRNYLLAFQNNAEATALGGSAASFTMLTIDHGKVTVSGQGSSEDIEQGAVNVPVDPSAITLYSTYLISHSNTATSRPDFPTAAEILRAFWIRDKGTPVDGVISVDPLALAQILKATGPVPLPSGDILTSKNAVGLLTNKIYFQINAYADPLASDAFFHSAASAILGKLMTGKFDPKTMAKALEAGVNQGSIMAWSNTPSEEALMNGSMLQGVLPHDNKNQTDIGVYFRDTSGSKIDYYMQSSTDTSSDLCAKPTAPTFATTVTLHLNLTPAQAAALPAYVASEGFGTTMFSTQIFVYGPIGASLTSTAVLAQGVTTQIGGSAVDLGRPVAVFTAYLAPGQTSTVSVKFTGAAGSYGPLQIRNTPMINTTANTVTTPGCG
jgi:Protein of unknown function (DUF4012)